MSFSNGVVSIGTTATELCVVPSTNGGVLVQAGAKVIHVGGAGVTAADGIKITATKSQLIPTSGGGTNTLYAISTTTASTVVYLYCAD